MTVLTDTFNRSNQTNLGTASGGWTWGGSVGGMGTSTLDIVSNQAKASSGLSSAVVHAQSAFGTSDNYAQASIVDAGNGTSNAGVFCRGDNASNFYLGLVVGGGTNAVALFKCIAGIFTQLGDTISVTVSLPQVLRVEAIGSTIKLYWDGVEKISVTDTAILSGTYCGIRAGGQAGGIPTTYENFEAGDLTDIGTAFTLIANTAAQGDSGGATTSAINTTGANLLIVGCSHYSTGTEATISDSKGNTWIPLDLHTGPSGDGNLRLRYCANPTVGTGHTFTASQAGSYASLAVLAFSGASSAPFDQQNGVNTSTGIANLPAGSVTPTQSDELIVTQLQPSSITTGLAIGSSFTISNAFYIINGVSFGIALAYKIKSSANTENPVWTWTSGNAGAASSIATFKSGKSPDTTVNAAGVSATGSVGTVTITGATAAITGKVLVVGGGGGAAGYRAGGGGGGGVVYDTAYSLAAGAYTVTVGAGGTACGSLDSTNTNGSNSVFGSLTALGGGRGGGGGSGIVGGDGGCGGGTGGPGGSSTTPVAGGAGSQGGNGGAGFAAPRRLSGGGGGAGGNGEDAEAISGGGIGSAGDGGPGLSNSITGSAVYYAGGGGGSFSLTPGVAGVGGVGGGGNACGEAGVDCTGASGTANTGGGGGGGFSTGSLTGFGGAGGSGVVIVAYPTASFTHTGGDATGIDGSYTWVKFNSSGTLTLASLLTSLVSYWKLNESSGNAIDSHGTNNLTDHNTVGAATGKINGGRDFIPANFEYFIHANNADLTVTGSFTFQAWVKVDDLVNYRAILSKTDTNATYEYLFTFWEGKFGLELYSTDQTGYAYVSDTFGTKSAGVWYLVHAWYDQVAGQVGISVNAGTPATAAFSHPIGTIADFALGATLDGGEPGSSLWDGVIDEVGFWKRALSSGERTTLYNAGNGLAYPFTPPVPGDATVNAAGVFACGVIGIPNPTVPGGTTRVYFYNESLGVTSVTSTTFAAKASVTFTPEASTDYFVIASVRMGMGTAQGSFRVRNTTNSLTLSGDVILTAKDPSLPLGGDNETQFTIEKWTSSTAVSTTISLEIRSVSGVSASFDKATLLILKADPLDQYIDSDTDSTSINATLIDKATLTWTPASTGDYLILASAICLNNNASGTIRTILDYNAGTLYGEAVRGPQALTDAFTWSTMVRRTALSGSQTFKVRFANQAALGTTTVRQATILALRLDKFQVAQYAEVRARTTTAATTYGDKVTLTFTPAAKAHLIFACGLLDHSATSSSAYAQLLKGSTSVIESMHESKTTTPSVNLHAFHWMQVETQAASSTTWKTQFKAEAGTSGFAESAIAALEFASAGTHAGMVAAGVSAIGRVGTVTVEAAAAPTTVNVTGVSSTGQLGTVTVSTVGNATVNATGVSSAGQVGTVAPSGSATLTETGVAATGQIGTVSVTTSAVTNATASPTGVSATGQVGTVTLAAGALVTETGLSATGQVGTVTLSGTSAKTVTGVSSTGQIGTVAPSGSTSVTETGLFATGQVGGASVSVTANPSVTVTGVAATGQVGGVTVLAGGNVSVSPTGVAATGQVGTVTVTGTTSVTETGLAATGQVGTVAITGSGNVTVTGLSATGQVGGVTVLAGGNVSVTATGVMGTGQIGTVLVQVVASVTVFLSGVSTTGQIGTVTPYIGDIEPPVESLPNVGGSISFGRRRKKRDTHVIRYSDFSTQEAYAAALSQAAIPLTQVSMDPAAVTPEDEFEDDEDILFAIVKLYH